MHPAQTFYSSNDTICNHVNIMNAGDYSLCKAMRETIFDLDGRRCVQCGRDYGLTVHHITYSVPCRSDNLVTLCKWCHMKIHKFNKVLPYIMKFTNVKKRRRLRRLNIESAR